MLITIDFARLPSQIQPTMNAPERITARLGEDFNWWVESTDTDLPHARGVLDPRQVAHLVQTLDEYRRFGYRPGQLAGAFQAYRLDAELNEGEIRLAATDQSILEDGGEVFALPLVGDEQDGPYYNLLEAVSAARIRQLNATHHFVHQCTVDEMTEELDLLDSDRYFSDETIHVFDELNEILEWSPAEWDESSS
jgi:hypothetical protein